MLRSRRGRQSPAVQGLRRHRLYLEQLCRNGAGQSIRQFRGVFLEGDPLSLARKLALKNRTSR